MPGTRPGMTPIKRFISTSHDQQIVRGEADAGLDLHQRDRRRLRSVGAELKRLVRGVEGEFVAAGAVRGFVPLGGEGVFVGAGPGEGGGGGGVVDDFHSSEIAAGRVTVGGMVGERPAEGGVVGEECKAESATAAAAGAG